MLLSFVLGVLVSVSLCGVRGVLCKEKKNKGKKRKQGQKEEDDNDPK